MFSCRHIAQAHRSVHSAEPSDIFREPNIDEACKKMHGKIIGKVLRHAVSLLGNFYNTYMEKNGLKVPSNYSASFCTGNFSI